MAALIFLSASISGSEVGVFSLSPSDLKEIEDEKSAEGKKIKHLLSNTKKTLATILIANNFVNVAIIILSTYLVESLISFDGRLIFGFLKESYFVFLIQTLCITFLLLLFGEVLPKIYAKKEPLKIIKAMSGSLFVLEKIFHPVSFLLVNSTNFIDKRFAKNNKSMSRENLTQALDLAAIHESTEEEQKIFRGIVKFGNTEVTQVMTSRIDVVTLELQTKYQEVLKTILEAGFSRIPIFKGNFDSIIGILYIKDLLPHLNKRDFSWQKLMRAAFFVPENKKIDDLLKEFQERKIHMAIVVDEYGGTKGIITLEDILEEIVGDIADEFDEEDIFYSKIDDYNYIFEGKVMLKDMYRVLDIEGDNFEEHKGDSDSLAGFILEQAGKIPEKGEQLQFENYLFTIESADFKRINSIKLTIIERNEESEESH